MVIADPTLRDEIAMRGMRDLMRRTGLSQHTIEEIRSGEPVRQRTLQRVEQRGNSRLCHTKLRKISAARKVGTASKETRSAERTAWVRLEYRSFRNQYWTLS